MVANDREALREPSAHAIMRRALSPGTGNHQYFVVTDCTTQRKLDERGITFDVVLTS